MVSRNLLLQIAPLASVARLAVILMSGDVSYPTRSYPYRPIEPTAAGVAPAPDTPISGLPPVLKARLVGVDQPSGRDLTPEELSRLSDPMAELVLKRGTFPTNLQELVHVLDAPPAAIPVQTVFIVSEWGQIPLADTGQHLRRQLRYVVARGKPGIAGADVLISTAPPSDSSDIFLQVAAWDPTNELFHYYDAAKAAQLGSGKATPGMRSTRLRADKARSTAMSTASRS